MSAPKFTPGLLHANTVVHGLSASKYATLFAAAPGEVTP